MSVNQFRTSSRRRRHLRRALVRHVRRRQPRCRCFRSSRPAGRRRPPPTLRSRPRTSAAELPSRFKRQVVNYPTNEAPGTIVIDTPNTYPLSRARQRPRACATASASAARASPGPAPRPSRRRPSGRTGHPPPEMIERQPYLPRFMAGGPGNPLGARAMYLVRLGLSHPRHQRAADHRPARVVGLHPPDQRGRQRSLQRVKVGAKVVVLPMTGAASRADAVSAPIDCRF